jgi:DNA invertase Pin-like site-specific DNA recombinase
MNYFPAKGIRYICVIDGIDRLPYQQKQIGEFLSDSIKDVFAEYYIAEGSAKIRNSLDNRRKNGLVIGSHTPYGYKKDPNNKNKRIVDEEAAEGGKQIFKWLTCGMSVSNIVKKAKPKRYQQSHLLQERKRYKRRQQSHQQCVVQQNVTVS